MKKWISPRVFITLIIIISSTWLWAQEPEKKDSKADSTSKSKEKSFQEIITAKAVSYKGMLNVHLIDDKYYFEIPDSLFGRDILAITRMSKTPNGAGYGGEQANRQVVRFEKSPNKKVLIRVISFVNIAEDPEAPIAQAVENSNVAPIIAALDIKATRKDTSLLVDVTTLFNEGTQAFALSPYTKQGYKLRSVEKDKSFIQSIRAYPTNVEIKTTKTYSTNPPSLSDGSSSRPSNTVDLPASLQAGVVTFEMNTSMILLPKEPMRKRLFDPRVGIFASRSTVYSDNAQRALPETFVVPWRLEAKNDADALRQQRGELIEPAKPIVFYIDPATPLKWREYLKKGVEDWQPAFEQAGWKNAIQAKDWPAEDTTMSLEDARFSVIRYFASDIQNAYGPNVNDPRSGEILESHIGWYHNVMQLLKGWYTIQTAAVDPRARKNEFDDQLMGELIRFVSAHEVGHTIGLRHNFGASHATPVEKLRDKTFMDANGHTSSIMDYARFNYVAQPEDGITNLFPRVGDYDRWAIEWNYKPIYNTPDAKADQKILNSWYLEKVVPNPRLRFLTESSAIDPRAQSEDLSDNSMKASEYGIKNLQRIMPNIISWTKEEAKHYDMATETYGQVVSQYRRYMGHVAKWVGGVYETPKTSDQEGSVYEPAPADMQRSAVQFLNTQLFQTPEWLIPNPLMQLLKPDNGVASLGQIQESTLNSLLSTSRLQRMIENEYANAQTYTVTKLLDDTRDGIWSELKNGKTISVHRRNLQKMYLNKLMELAKGEGSSSSSSIAVENTDITSLARAHLEKLKSMVKSKSSSYRDDLSRYHLKDCLAKLNAFFDED